VVSGSGADRYALDLGFSATGRVICCGALCTVRSTASRPKVAVLLGTNDIGWLQRTATDTVACIDALVAELHLRLPGYKDPAGGSIAAPAGGAAGHGRDHSALAARYGNGQVPYVASRDISPALFKYGVLASPCSAIPSRSSRNRLCTLLREGRIARLLLLSRRRVNLWGTCGMTADLGRASEGSY
jgi:hypothetical protein